MNTFLISNLQALFPALFARAGMITIIFVLYNKE
jgi:hypothetical protein